MEPNFPTNTFKRIIKFTLQDMEKEVETSKHGNFIGHVTFQGMCN